MPKKPKHSCACPGYNQLVDGRYCEERTKVRNSQYEKYGRNPGTRQGNGSRVMCAKA